MRLFRKTAATLLAAALTLALFATSCNTDPAGSSSDGSASSGSSSTVSTGSVPNVTNGPAPAVEFELNTTNATILGKSSTAKGGYTFSYGSSGFSVNFTGTEFWMYIPEVPKADNTIQNVGVAVLVDSDMAMDATMVTIDRAGWIKLVDGLEDGEHYIEVRKQYRNFFGMMQSDWFNVTKFGANEGATVKTPDPLSDLVIEVYGDSISNGDAVWDNGAENGIAYTFGSYTGVLERLLDAEVRVTANSGNGLLGWCLAGDANGQLDNLYPPQQSWNVFDPHVGINEDYSHEGANAADVVIINLGTNDRVEYNNGDLSDEAFNEEYLRFIKQIKTDCPDAIVICTLGAMDGIPEFGDNLPKIAKDANEWAEETFCYYFELQKCGTITGGYAHDNSHPSNLAHEIYGLQLATLINGALDLNKTLPTDIPESAYDSNEDVKDPAKSGTPIDGGLKVYGDVNVVDRMFDGNTATGWQLQNKSDMGENCWAGVMFAAPVKVTGVDITWEDVTRPNKETGYRLEYTSDGENWQAVPDISVEFIANQTGTNYCVDSITFPELDAKGIRVVVLKHDNSGKDYASQIYEFEVAATGEVSKPEGNLMDAVTGKTDNLTRVQDALELKNLQ